ncbi:MAG TPA: hypothetical protein PKE26_12415 [Kiritimatiellia bacterium]|nr:hypothetical protein [Kiritimatiellia bacterium]HMO99904.1 hypothetical protein [Kiritimatiellia bacterium]HMP96045.1 hypothetical protein [Kiritimatiellia bacterium]
MNKNNITKTRRVRRYRPRAFSELPVDWRLVEGVRMHNGARNYAGSARLLREFVEQSRDVPVEVYFHLALAYNRLGQSEQAQAALLTAIEREPGYQEAISFIGHAFTCTRDFELAGHYLRLAIALDPTDYIPWGRLSNLYTAMGDLEATLMVQREAIRRNPGCPMLRRRFSELILFGLDDPP